MKSKNFLFCIIILILPAYMVSNAQVKKPSYSSNPIYQQQIELYDVYKLTQADVVMLGDSRTQGASWHELLGRTDVAGRGIESDIFEGYSKRMSYVYKLKPKVCFVSGGVNDLYSGAYTPDQVYQAFVNIIADLKIKKVIPVIQSIVFVGRDWGKGWNITAADNKFRNTEIAKINKMLSDYAKRNNIEFLDINPRLQTSDNFLRSEFTWDGIHFRAAAYKIWAEEVDKVLKKLKI